MATLNLDLLAAVVSNLIVDFAMIYARSFMQPGNIVFDLFMLLILYLIIQVIMQHVPVIGKLITLLVYPFSLLHLHVHFRVAQYLSQRRMHQYQEWRDFTQIQGATLPFELQQRLLDNTRMRPLVGWSHSKIGESARVYIPAGTFIDTVITALSPFFVAVSFFVVVIPVREIFLSHTTDTVTKALIHAYFSLVIFGGLMPSLADFRMVTYVGIRDRKTPLWVITGIIALSLEMSLLIFLAFSDFLLAVIIGAIAALLSHACFTIWESLVTVVYHVIMRTHRSRLEGRFGVSEMLGDVLVLDDTMRTHQIQGRTSEIAMVEMDLLTQGADEDDNWWHDQA